MIKPEYKRELSHSYLILDDIPKEKMDNYQYRMILKNKIPGLLCSSERYINGKVCLYYDISSRQSLDQLYEAGTMSFTEILRIVEELARILEGMSGFLLEEQNLLLDPRYMYLDLDTEQLCLLYYPFAEMENPIGSIYMPVAEFFLEHVDHKEEMAVSAAYQFYKMSKAESFALDSFRGMWEKSRDPGREAAKPVCYAGKTLSGSGENGYPEWVAEEGDWQEQFYEEPGLYTFGSEYERQGIAPIEEKYIRDYTEKDITGKKTTERKKIPDKKSAGRREAENKETDKKDGNRKEGYRKERNKKEGNKKETYEKERNREREEKADGETQEDRLCKMNLAGLGAACLAFAILCMFIWYLQPEDTVKAVLFGLLAMDGLVLLVFLWRLLVKKGDEKEEERAAEEYRDAWEAFDWLPEYKEGDNAIYRGTQGISPVNTGGYKTKAPALTGKADGREIRYRLEPLPMIAGKLRNRVQLLLSDASVSRIHARFVEKEGRVALMDLNSTNGTYINGIRLEQNESMLLEHGDEIRLGDMVLHYEEFS